MAYEISFRTSAEEAFEHLNQSEAERLMKKQNRVAGDEFRTPQGWDYKPFGGQRAAGKFNGGAYRVFADVVEYEQSIIVDTAQHRENLY